MKHKWIIEFLPKENEPKEGIVAYWLSFALGTFGTHLLLISRTLELYISRVLFIR